MSDRTPSSETGGDTGGRGLPRWVRLAAVVLALVILVAVAVMAMGGPGGHMSLLAQ